MVERQSSRGSRRPSGRRSAGLGCRLGAASAPAPYSAWTAGGGLEAAITNDLSARVEYLYVDTGTTSHFSAPPPSLGRLPRVRSSRRRRWSSLSMVGQPCSQATCAMRLRGCAPDDGRTTPLEVARSGFSEQWSVDGPQRSRVTWFHDAYGESRSTLRGRVLRSASFDFADKAGGRS